MHTSRGDNLKRRLEMERNGIFHTAVEQAVERGDFSVPVENTGGKRFGQRLGPNVPELVDRRMKGVYRSQRRGRIMTNPNRPELYFWRPFTYKMKLRRNQNDLFVRSLQT